VLSAGDQSLLIPFEIASLTYPGQDVGVATVAAPALLVATSALTEAEALQIQPATARKGISLPLHAGANRFFREAAR